MNITELAGWTPVRVDVSGLIPTVDWADLSRHRFAEPFFDQTVARLTSGAQAGDVIRTGLGALLALDSEPSLELAGMTFHSSRCGSTLVSRLLNTIDGVVVVAEPSPLNALLGLDPETVDGRTLVRLVRALVRALGRRHHDDERTLVLKCTSWNIRRRAVLADAFPDTPWVWVQRDPAHVLASLLASPPGWLVQSDTPPPVAQLLGLDPSAIPGGGRVEFAARALGAMLSAAAGDADGRLVIDYAQLPTAVWERVAPHFGLAIDSAAIDRMNTESRFYSKALRPQFFTGDVARHRPLTNDMRLAAQLFAESAYRVLAEHP